MKIKDLNKNKEISNRCCNALINYGIEDLEDILNMSIQDIGKIRNLGQLSMKELFYVMKIYKIEHRDHDIAVKCDFIWHKFFSIKNGGQGLYK